MKYILLIFITLSIQITFADESNSLEGKALYESHCIECHSRMTGGDGHVIYTRDDRIAKDITQLSARVAHCAKGSNVNWSESEINLVTNYLNEQYYHY